MADKPILFSGSMVRALLAGNKTQTRRALSFEQPIDTVRRSSRGNDWFDLLWTNASGQQAEWYKPRHSVGDRLYVREHWRTQEEFDGLSPVEIGEAFAAEHGKPWCPVFFVADGKADDTSIEQWQESPLGRFRQGMHMPRWASRLTLTVTEVRVERLKDISEADALAEGMTQATADAVLSPEELAVYATTHIVAPGARGRILYETIWDQINGAGAWQANPWVAAYTFTVEHGNIDQLVSQAHG